MTIIRIMEIRTITTPFYFFYFLALKKKKKKGVAIKESSPNIHAVNNKQINSFMQFLLRLLFCIFLFVCACFLLAVFDNFLLCFRCSEEKVSHNKNH